MRGLDVHDVGAMAPPVTVIGDLHLTEERPDLLAHFESFAERLEAAGTLVLLGDVFDWWVGAAQARETFAARVLERLRALADRGIRLAFVRGNRDFAFEGGDGLALDLWPDVVRARWGDRTVVLSHGDLLCTADVDYLRMRRVLRSAPMTWLRHHLPPDVLYGLARRLRRASVRAQNGDPTKERGIDYGEARRWLEDLDADALVLGHVHTGVHHRLGGERPRDVYVLKDWDAGPNAVRFDGTGITLAGV